MQALAMTLDEVRVFLDQEFPQHIGVVEQIFPMGATLRLPIAEEHLRPGGTVSGPTMMALADVAIYVALLAQIGPKALAVTTSLQANFLNKPSAQQDLIAQTRLLKLGKRLVVGEVEIYSQGAEDMVAHITATYSIPPRE
ncbi:uncharacterized domain 1-containing protein [Allopseudospirillum japonicum]|uniref:Uncharacterized domain 1-containing protein n=1 Tax=Allopseudospirillum japonicum TaxID=64971 RepID=A0A1H6QTM3_9GAMM|nr:PaaI family thioesterase [Allopseudospirillum japonicum]SEI45406.1 uncharacterized domain 1-containing protein [Allopseudospirillum japonicum]